MRTSMSALLLPVILASTTIGAATAPPVEPRPDGDQLPSFTARVDFRQLGPELDALTLARRLQPRGEDFDPELYERLGRPIRAAQAIAQAPLPPWIAVVPFGERWLMDRVLRLEYPADADFRALEE